MKEIIFFLIIGILFSCNLREMDSVKIDYNKSFFLSIQDSLTTLEKGIKMHCMDGINAGKLNLMFATKTRDKSLYVEVWNGYLNKFECAPFILTKNCLGDEITRFNLTNKPCYFGTDTGYNPVFEIKTDGTIVLKECSIINQHKGWQSITTTNGEKVLVGLMDQKTHCSIKEFKIRSNGLIDETNHFFEILPIPDER